METRSLRRRSLRGVGSAVAARLRAERLQRELTQEALGEKIQLSQHHISNIENALVDPRLSTVMDLARALDLELMLVPRRFLPAVEALQSSESTPAASRPMYALDDDADGDELA